MEKTYLVLEADYLDQLEGIVPGATVRAEPGETPRILNVQWVGDDLLNAPVPVFAAQLQEISG